MLAIWRVHGFDAILREAWESGVVLSGASAGMICWFEAGVTDSFGPQLDGMPTASASCPAARARTTTARSARRPRYRELVDGGLSRRASRPTTVSRCTTSAPSCDEVVTCRPGAAAYRVTRDGEERLEARELN